MTTTINIAAGYSNDLKEQNKIKPIYLDETFYPLAPNWYTKPTNYAQLVSWYQTLESQYPDYIEVFKANELYDIDQATGGYDIYYVRITNELLGLNKPEVLFLGGPHGDETVGTVGMFWFTDWLMRMAFTDETNQEFTKDYLQWIIDNREIYIEVSHNPWGFDHGPQRYDANGWDLNREADYDGPGYPAVIWGSNNGKTLRAFIDNHVVRAACDFHGGARMLLYPWGSTHAGVYGTSPISGRTYGYAPPDFYFFDASSLRVGDYMGDYGGDLDPSSVGTIPDTVGYVVNGGISPWAYGADVEKNPVEDPYVQDETWGNYPGAGILWLSPEMSYDKNPGESTFGNDTVLRYGAEVRRFILHQTDLAQPYLRWQAGTVENDIIVNPGTTIELNWQVNGSLVVDHTYIQWGTDPDPVNNYDFTTSDYNEYADDYYGGTGWDNAESGITDGVTYNEEITLDHSGDYYFVSKAQVDQIYINVLHPEIYGNNPYLRLVKERTNDDYYEMIDGTDGIEEMFGQTWWYSPIIHVSVSSDPPTNPIITGPTSGKVGTSYKYTFTSSDPDGDQVYYYIEWDDGNTIEWDGPHNSGQDVTISHTWNENGTYTIKAKAKDSYGAESGWGTLTVTMPKNKVLKNTLFFNLLEQFPNALQIIRHLIEL